MAAALDGEYELVAGAFSSDPTKSQATGLDLGLDPARAYDSYEQMAESEHTLSESDRIELVSIAQLSPASVLVIAVPHQVFGTGEELISKLMYSDGVLVDVKSAYRDVVANRPDFTYWSL